MGHATLLGAWNLISIYGESEEGDIFKPYGDKPAGVLMYTLDGSMAAVLMKQGRPKFASGDPTNATPEELKAAFAGFDAYCGTFTLNEDEGTVIHHVEAARFPNWEGSEQVRYFELDGETLRISSAPIHAMGKNWIIHVVWERK
jgi:hypothetical protein